jgi:hypothetical protein
MYLSAGAENLFVAHICLCSLRGLPARVLFKIKRLALIHHEQIIDAISITHPFPNNSTCFAVFVLKQQAAP